MNTTKTKTKNKEIIYYETEPDITIIQEIVNGYFTIIPLTKNKSMYVDEEGELKELKVNVKATEIVGYNIYGNVLIVGSE
tara:strand:+ start:1696 stop:1935 length:240 start_codon:yes stop_codon:yes gene_type:complete